MPKPKMTLLTLETFCKTVPKLSAKRYRRYAKDMRGESTPRVVALLAKMRAQNKALRALGPEPTPDQVMRIVPVALGCICCENKANLPTIRISCDVSDVGNDCLPICSACIAKAVALLEGSV